MTFPSIRRCPDYITIETQEHFSDNAIIKEGAMELTHEDMTFSLTHSSGALAVCLRAEHTRVTQLRLRWNGSFPPHTRFLGDAWERSYGDLEWRGMVATRVMPWYFLASAQDAVGGYGVRVRPGAICYWQTDSQGLTLFLDVRSGGRGVNLQGRTLKICEIVSETYLTPDAFLAATQFCARMCSDPILPKFPVYGSNNWYYAYGVSSAEEILQDTDYLCELIDESVSNRPFMVVDDGWQYAHTPVTCNGGPWHMGNTKFPDMAQLASDIKQKRCRPGLWMRLLLTTDETLPQHYRFPHKPDVLDPSVPDVLEYVHTCVKRAVFWGYELIKHDFSTFDIFGAWGFEMSPSMASGSWHFADESRTTAEIIISLYRTILDAAGELPNPRLQLYRTSWCRLDASATHW